MLRVVSIRECGTWGLKPHRGERESLIESAFLSFSTSALLKLDLNPSSARHKAEGDPYLEVNRTPGTEPETRVTLVRCRR
jgi:hypothetical protein